ncbi:E3 ubiquitin-protein ligase TRIM39 [Xenopus tropicalis]|uniref:E3 ubiquitin-protein ligase TRIM39 n=1 Tax=Xenopus tropicalis TaxID=8364 RepID=A0A8J0R8L1_XENTR|nr:E3 ubiquitin-protein ligase TRIM39 [Xenopus tropicalis]|eukprot:XP_004919979.2 PREDICTED: E3 ubiquitin-protein ligase TRIM39-like [Xenopus tropicalis]
MAFADLREELNCSLCLDIYTQPVMLPCGHNFCQGCIGRALDAQGGSGGYSCPECRAEYQKRPALPRNRTLGNIAERFHSAELEPGETGIPCTYCVISPVHAVKSCLLCETSMCGVHLKVHSESEEHVLTEPTASFENRKCSTHKELLKYYCPQDGACICVSCCLAGEHRGHKVEPLSEASEKKKEKLRKVLEKLSPEREETEGQIQRLQERRKELQEKAAGVTEQINALFRDIRERLSLLEEQLHIQLSMQKVMVSLEVWDLIRELEIKKDEMSPKIRHIEELCNMADPLAVLQGREEGDTEGADNEGRQNDDTKVPAVGDVDVGLILGTLSAGLHRFLNSLRVNSKLCRQEASGMQLDINTAGNYVAVSGDGKTATWTQVNQHYPKTPQRFMFSQVLSSMSFCSGQHYWEVEGSASGGWRVGVAYPTIERQGECSVSGSNAKSWSLSMYHREYSVRHDRTATMLPGKLSSQRFGIFLDYEAGRLSFYELSEPIRHLHTFSASFTEPLCASFYVSINSWVKLRN